MERNSQNAIYQEYLKDPLSNYLPDTNDCLFTDFPIYTCKRIETRTRKENVDTALSLGVHDPLWLLARQWQFGEFKGDDGGSAILTKVKLKKSEFSELIFSDKKRQKVTKKPFNNDVPLEYLVERMNVEITPAVRVKSACYFEKMVKNSAVKSKSLVIYQALQNKFPLKNPFDSKIDLMSESTDAATSLSEIKIRSNDRLERFMAAYSNRTFDGYELYLYLLKSPKDIEALLVSNGAKPDEASKLLLEYREWFKEHYLPSVDGENCWVDEQLGYDFALTAPDINNQKKTYAVEDYSSGNLSWYSFDAEFKKGEGTELHNGKTRTEMFTMLPTPANFPDAPNKRLWKFEDANVRMGNSQMGSSALANAVVLQYTTMYGNDWLLVPVDLETGTITEVMGIVITDVFGQRYYIDRPTGSETNIKTSYRDKWEMFTVSNKDAYQHNNFASDGRLFYPPSLVHNEESNPIEEIQFLRDEMANMVWGVETRINSGCGSSMDGTDYASKIASEVEELRPVVDTESSVDADSVNPDYSYLLQNNVPLNWVPFLPVKFSAGEQNAIREIRLQRAAMPLFVKNEFRPVRPCSVLLRKGIDNKDTVSAHYFINEEEILAVGTKLILTYQQTRWLNGKRFNWLGAKKQLSKYQANSGLAFDELIEKIKSSAPKLDANKF